MKKELKEVLHYYLPYNVKIIISHRNQPDHEAHLTPAYLADCTGVKPILHPLAKLTKELSEWAFNHNGEWFDEIVPAKYWIEIQIESDDIGEMPFALVEKILSLHGDLFGLIESGQAIEK